MANSLSKGHRMEEALRTYFSQAGYFVVRGVPFKYQGYDVTDIDGWLYTRSSPVSREITIVDIKNKKTPQAIERIFWTLGLQKAIGADRAIVATSEKRVEVKEFGKKFNIVVLDGNFISKLEQKGNFLDERLSDEELNELINSYAYGKLDGDWRGRISYCKSLLPKGLSFDICNDLLSNAKFFAQMAVVRPEQSTLSLRCFYFVISLVAITIDYLMRDISFMEHRERATTLTEGFRYGSRGKQGFETVVSLAAGLVEQYSPSGKSAANEIKIKVRDDLQEMPTVVLGEFFSRRDVYGSLFNTARELETLCMRRHFESHTSASIQARSMIGCLLDYWGIDRTHLALHSRESSDQLSLLKPP